MNLIAISWDGVPESPIENLPGVAGDVMKSTVEMYRTTGYHFPWFGYLAVDKGTCVGTCTFKALPVAGKVRIAYFTFPGYEGRGIASRMVADLIDLAISEAPDIRICARTLPTPNAATRVLEKSGFQKVAEVDRPQDGWVWEWEHPSKTGQPDPHT